MTNRPSSRPPAPLPSLPTEVWENVIDRIPQSTFLDRTDQTQLAVCCLVCRSWVPRCRYHLYQSVIIQSFSDLEGASQCLSGTPGLSARIERLLLRCPKDTSCSQSWVSLVPLYLPHNRSLEDLIIRGFDFSQRYPNFFQAYRQLQTVSLYLHDITYSRISHLVQLARATGCHSMTVDGSFQPSTQTVHNPDPILFGGVYLRYIAMTLPWDVFSYISRDWGPCPYGPADLSLNLHRAAGMPPSQEEEGRRRQGDNAAWMRLAKLFHKTWTLRSMADPTSSTSFSVSQDGPGFTLTSKYDSKIHMRSQKVYFTQITQALSMVASVLRGIAFANCILGKVIFPPIYYNEEGIGDWKVVDDALAHPHFASLEKCSVRRKVWGRGNIDDDDDLGPHRCLHGVYRERLPRLAARGYLQCNLEECKLRSILDLYPITSAYDDNIVALVL